MADGYASPADGKVGQVTIKVVGCGGGGSNAVTRMYRDPIQDVEYVTLNTDHQALTRSEVPTRLRIGDRTARGLGVGGDPDRGRECAEESREEVKSILQGADLVFIAAGMGGGTGTGSAPVVAEVAREMGALTVGVVTKPFAFEGNRRMKQAQDGISKLEKFVDTLIVIPNDRLLAMATERLTMEMSFRMADDVLRQAIQAIAELITVPGEINLDFADVKAVMKNSGPAWLAIGRGSGPDRAVMAAETAISSPLLEVSMSGARGIIFNITGGQDLTLQEVNEASEVIRREADPEANIIFGQAYDPKMENEVKITLIATGFPSAQSVPHEDAMKAALSEALTNEETLDLPPFLRHNPAAARRRMANGAGLMNGR
ncbi:MAG: cell division protein FtsZ [Dehalococcoidia bacterium]|nr:cell division protein FtsZ [Dehalococcoidia bacterium]MSQ35181.1 cell division protein FtsZ [Dehalococcoidia bacterium]